MVTLRPEWLEPGLVQHLLPESLHRIPVFVIHPETSVLAEQLVIDSTALQNENYSGIYDESGDYIPMYCDNPDEIPQGALAANIESTGNAPESPGGTSGPDGAPSEPPKGSSDDSEQ